MASYYFDRSIFKQFFDNDDPAVLNWSDNVLQKLVEKGLIPNYIERYNDINGDEDYKEFWGSICTYFAYYVIYARAYQTFYTNIDLLREYLEERGITTSPNDTLPELYYLMQHFSNEIFHRGTIHIIDMPEQGYDVFGELLRLIQYKDGDEFIFNLNKPEYAGWNLNNCSPLYRSLTKSDNANKWYEKSIEPVDITKYPILNVVTIETDTDINKKVLKIDQFGLVGSGGTSKYIKVSPYLDYEFSFLIKKDDGENFTVGFAGLDENLNSVYFKKMTDGSTSLGTCLQQVNLQRSDKYLLVKVYLYNKLKPLDTNDTVNQKIGDAVKYVQPYISMTDGVAYVYNVRFMPMLTPYGKGFVQLNNFIDCWIKNNNSGKSFQNIFDFTKKYLTPYNSQIEFIDIEKAGDTSSEVATEVLDSVIYATSGDESTLPKIYGINIDKKSLYAVMSVGYLGGVTNGVYQLSITKEGVFYIVSGQDKKIRRINIDSNSFVDVYTTTQSSLYGAVFDYEGNLYVLSPNKLIKIIGIDPSKDNSVKTELIITLPSGYIGSNIIGDLTFFEGDLLIVSGDSNGDAKMWKVNFTNSDRVALSTPGLTDLGYIKDNGVLISSPLNSITSIRGNLYGFDSFGKVFRLVINTVAGQIDAFEVMNTTTPFRDAAGYNDPFQSRNLVAGG